MIIAPRIVAVDDNPEHLLALERAFDDLGGLCECVEFARAIARNKPFVSGVRILFMDINLLPGAGADQGGRTFSPITSVIARLISNDNGPYALVTWTANLAAHDALVDHLEQHLPPALRPCATYCLSKDEYLDAPQALLTKLETLAADIPGLAMLLDWERAVTLAADRSVLEIAGLSGLSGRGQGNAVAQAVRAISDAAAGQAASAEHPFRAFCQGMSGVLSDQLDHAAAAEATEQAWKAALAQPVPVPDDRQRAALNTFMHFEPPSDALRAALGTIYAVRFSDLQTHFRDWFSTSRAAITSKEFLPIKGNRLQTDAEKASFARACSWRFIQLGAPCDHVNGKTRVLDGILALEVPERVFDDTNLKSDGQFRDAPAKLDWLFQTPPMLGPRGRYVIVANLRFRIGFPLQLASSWPRVGRLRDGLASEIATHSAAFGTRPGIVEFR